MKIKELKDGLTMERIKEKYQWILEADIEDAVLGEYNNEIIWYEGNWEGGDWKGGYDGWAKYHRKGDSPNKWSKKWMKGWREGEWKGKVWHNGRWEMGEWI